jgi:dihydrofolate synthase/folylpolyglutamate synthase
VVTAITTIALDHQQYLGDTLEDIAREKAGIIKRSRPSSLARSSPPHSPFIEAVRARRTTRRLYKRSTVWTP